MHAPVLQERPCFGVEPDGTIEGYASLFGVVDAAHDAVMPGAFATSLKKRGLRRVPMLFQHDPGEPIGIWLELREDFRGLYARGKLIPDVARAREVLALIRAQALDGLSIGFRAVKGRIDPRTRVRRLDAIELWEISVVTFPLLDGARVQAVKGLRFSYPRQAPLNSSGARSPRPSFARARAESEWRQVARAQDLAFSG
jgi:HK97 family phage prohead protease